MCVLRHAHLRLHRCLLLLVQHPLVSRLVPAAVLLVLLEQLVHLVVATHVRRVLQLSPRDHSHLVLLLEDHAAFGTHRVVAVVLRLLLHVMQQLTALRHQFQSPNTYTFVAADASSGGFVTTGSIVFTPISLFCSV